MTNYNIGSYLAKSILHLEGRWDIFCAGITKVPSSTDPLAFMQLRNPDRHPPLGRTFGMMRTTPVGRSAEGAAAAATPSVPSSEETYEWGWKEVKMRTVGGGYPKHTYHPNPMYSAKEKEGYSKIQSTTFIDAQNGIHPRLFPNQKPYELRVGALFPALPRFTRPNRIMIYDSGTIARHYDLKEIPPNKRANSYEELRRDPRLKNIDAHLTEILARLRWYNPQSLEPNDTLFEPAILVSFLEPSKEVNLNRSHFANSIILGLLRAMDLKFALLRKGFRLSIVSIVIYDYKSQSPFSMPLEFNAETDAFIVLQQIFSQYYPSPLRLEEIQWDFKNDLIQIHISQKIYQHLETPSGTHQFSLYSDIQKILDTWSITDDKNAGNLYNNAYIETLRAICKCLPKTHPLLIKKLNSSDLLKFLDEAVMNEKVQDIYWAYYLISTLNPTDMQKLDKHFLPALYASHNFGHFIGKDSAFNELVLRARDMYIFSYIAEHPELYSSISSHFVNEMLDELIHNYTYGGNSRENKHTITNLIKVCLQIKRNRSLPHTPKQLSMLSEIWKEEGSDPTCHAPNCGKNLKLTLFKHRCRGCGESFCGEHIKVRVWPPHSPEQLTMYMCLQCFP